MAITIIFGVPRVGKTALMTSLALEYMHGVSARQDVRACSKLVVPMNCNGFNYTLPNKHLVFSDYYIQDRRDKITSYEIDGFFLGLPNSQHPTLFLPPCSRIYLDEAQKYFNSRERLSDFTSRFYELHGHNRYNVTIAVQRPNLIDVNVRELAVEVIEVLEIEHKYDHGLIMGSQWKCNLFYNTAKAQKYIESGKTARFGDKVYFEYIGNIFKHYDSYNFMPVFFKDNYTKPFDLVPSVKSKHNIQSMQEFNATHNYEVPETYYKAKKATSKGGK